MPIIAFIFSIYEIKGSPPWIDYKCDEKNHHQNVNENLWLLVHPYSPLCSLVSNEALGNLFYIFISIYFNELTNKTVTIFSPKNFENIDNKMTLE